MLLRHLPFSACFKAPWVSGLARGLADGNYLLRTLETKTNRRRVWRSCSQICKTEAEPGLFPVQPSLRSPVSPNPSCLYQAPAWTGYRARLRSHQGSAAWSGLHPVRWLSRLQKDGVPTGCILEPRCPGRSVRCAGKRKQKIKFFFNSRSTLSGSLSARDP